MITAIMLIKAHLKDIAAVIDALAEMEDIREIYTTTGQFDVVAVLQEKDTEALAETVTRRIAHVPGIVETSTLLAIRCHSPRLMERMFGVGMASDEEKPAEKESPDET